MNGLFIIIQFIHTTVINEKLINFDCLSVSIGSCGTPKYLSYGQRYYSGTTVGYTVTYYCNTGYRLAAGNSRRTCQLNGQWSGSHPVCASELLK